MPIVTIGSADSDSGAVTEDAAKTTASATLTATDVDGDRLTWSVDSSTPGTYGTLSVDQNGHWTYPLDNSRPATDALSDGRQVQYVFTVKFTDGHGGTDTQQVTVSVTGANDLPVVSAQHVDLPDHRQDEGIRIKKADLLRNLADVDAQDSLYLVGIHANHGTLTVDGDGYRYTPEPGCTGTVYIGYAVSDRSAAITGFQGQQLEAEFKLTPDSSAPVITGYSGESCTAGS